MDDQLKQAIHQEKLKKHLKTLPETIFLTIPSVAIILLLLWQSSDHYMLGIWVGIMAVSLFSYACAYYFLNRIKASLILWHTITTVIAIIIALAWGSLIFFTEPITIEQHLTVIVTMLTIASAASVSVLGYFRDTIYLYLLALLCPSIYYYFIEAQYQNFSIIIAVFGFFIAFNAYRINNDFTQSIGLQIQAKRDQKTIQFKDSIYQKLFENAPVSIVHYNNSGICLSTNPAFAKLTQSPPGYHVGKLSFESIRDEKVKQAIKTSLSKGYATFEGEYWMAKEESYKYLTIQFAGIRNIEGKIEGGIAIVQDLTERRKNELELIEAKENAIEAKEIKSQFLSRMSHELRTPMNAILGFAELLTIDKHATIEQKAHLKEITTAGNILLSQINEILDLAKFDKQNITLNLANINANNLCHTCANLITPLANNANLSLIINTTDKPIFVYADEQKLRQCLLNLLSNAIKYSDKKSRKIILNCYQVANIIRFEVIDKGIGIAKKDMSQVFQPFSRFNDNAKIEGTGIGLSITENLVDKMNGQIGCESTLNVGSTFWIELPAIDE